MEDSLKNDSDKSILYNHALVSASVSSANLQALRYLISEGFEFEYKEEVTDLTPLILAARHQRKDVLFYLLEQGSKINQKDEWVSFIYFFSLFFYFRFFVVIIFLYY